MFEGLSDESIDSSMSYYKKLLDIKESVTEELPQQLEQVTKDTLASNQPLTLPYWSNSHRGIPSEFIRSALFGIFKKGSRRYIDNEIIESWKNFELCFKGMQLDQSDMDVWMQVMHLYQGRDIENCEYVEFSERSFLSSISRAWGKPNRIWLKESLDRLVDGTIRIKVNDKRFYAGHLIDNYTHNETNGKWLLRVNAKIFNLYGKDYTRISWVDRLELNQDNLSKWLLNYIESHKYSKQCPHKIGLEKLQKLTNNSTTLREYRRRVKTSINKIHILKHWEINKNDILIFY